MGSWMYESVPKEEVWDGDMSLGVISLHMIFKLPEYMGPARG